MRLQLSSPNWNHHSAAPLGLPPTDKVKTSTGQHLWLVWFLFTLWALGLFQTVGNFFFLFLLFLWLLTWQACIFFFFLTIRDVFMYICINMSSLNPQMRFFFFFFELSPWVEHSRDPSTFNLSASTSKVEQTEGGWASAAEESAKQACLWLPFTPLRLLRLWMRTSVCEMETEGVQTL